MAQKENDLEKIKDIIEIMKDNGLVEVEIKHGDDKILLKRYQPQQPMVTSVPMITLPANQQAATGQVGNSNPEDVDDGLIDITSPIVGTYYRASSPDSDPFVEIGSHIAEQDAICVIEAMKVMNEIKAEVSGTVEKILVQNGQAVEYGQVIFKIRPD